jgi:dCMP deaminase
MGAMVIDRPTWHEYFFNISKEVSKRSTCQSRKVGCVIVNPETKNIVATGYNGAPRGIEHCGDECLTRQSGKEYKKCSAIHGELNARLSAAEYGVTTRGMEMYLTTTPCVFCSRTIINAGIKKVYALSYYPHPQALELLMQGEVDVIVLNTDTLPYFEKETDEEL